MADRDQLSLTAMPSELLLRLLKQNGAQYATEEALAADREAGAPISDDGTVNLVAYAAWLASEVAGGAAVRGP
jgi:hypothetical protein